MPKKLLFLILALFLSFCPGCATNPITGQQQFMLISEQQDIAIGRRYAPELEKQMGGRIANPALQNYVDSVGQRVARISHKPDLEYHFAALNHDSANAFALPGGYVFITKGMLSNLNSEAQLAAILAHEVVHIVARHASAAMSREIGIDILLSAVTSEKTTQTVSTVAGLTRQIIGLRYSRANETEADLAGLDYMVRAGYDPYAMVEAMQAIQSQPGTRPIEFLSTHPAPRNRTQYLTQKIHSSYSSLTGLKVGKEDFRRSVLERLDI